MPVLAQIQHFASEIVTAVAVTLAHQLPRAWRWGAARVRPDPSFPELLWYTRSAEVMVTSLSAGDGRLIVDIVNLGARDSHIEQCQVVSSQLNGVQVSLRDVSARPPRATIAARQKGSLSFDFHLDAAAVDALVSVIKQASGRHSTPRHSLRLQCQFVLERRLTRRVLGHRELNVDLLAVNVVETVARQIL